MHPRVFLDTFWRNDLRPDAFVAMPFRSDFDVRWDKIYSPAISDSPMSLRPVRVDLSRSGDSVLTEIVDGIAHSQIVVADISVTDRWGTDHYTRNANVMYEVGLALACRQPCEVLLIRDDDLPLLFDTSHLPVTRIQLTDTSAAKRAVQSAITDRLQERDKLKDLRVRKVVESLTQFEIGLIRSNAHLSSLGWTGPSYPAGVAMALPRILDKAILRLERVGVGSNPDVYSWTTFGRVIADQLGRAV